MKLSAQEEYGLRCLLTLARGKRGRSLTIPEIAEAEDIAPHSVAKYLRNLRQAGIIDSERGQHGGYSLARDPATITVADALTALGGRLYDDGFCNHYTGMGDFCQHSSVDCSIRGLWMRVQDAVDLANLINDKQVTPGELMALAQELTELKNEPVNAIVQTFWELADQQLNDLAEGPFAGIPFVIKNLNQQSKSASSIFSELNQL